MLLPYLLEQVITQARDETRVALRRGRALALHRERLAATGLAVLHNRVA